MLCGVQNYIFPQSFISGLYRDNQCVILVSIIDFIVLITLVYRRI